MVARVSCCLRELSEGDRSLEVRFGRFLGNDRVGIDDLIEGWSARTASAADGRHVLAIQDTSEINFPTTADHRRGLGEIGKGVGRGVLVHAMVAVDADSGACLGLVGGRVWTRPGRITVPHDKRALPDKESERWVSTGERAGKVLAGAAMVTVVGDRESDVYAVWAMVPAPGVHVVGRVMADRRLADGGLLSTRGEDFAWSGSRSIELPDRGPGRQARTAHLRLRFGPVSICRPRRPTLGHLPNTLPLTYVEVLEPAPPEGTEPLHWRLLTTHAVGDVAAAWQIVDWYRRRWLIEQLFRLMKTQGLRIEDSQVETADRLIKLTAIAAKAACVILQLTQARDGRGNEPAATVFREDEVAVLDALNTGKYAGRTERQKNPHAPHSLAWASWIIARLGGWNGYPSSRPPGPVTLRRGLEHFKSIVEGWSLRNVCIP